MTESDARSVPALKPGEELAAKVVAAVLALEYGEPVTMEHWDVPPRQGEHDFWVCRGGAQEALEVTTLAEQGTRTDAAHWRKRGPDSSVTVEGVAWAWMILVDQTFRADALTKNIADWLRELESEGITETGRWDSRRAYVHPVTMSLAAAGVLIASGVPGGPAGMVSLAYVSDVPRRLAGDPDHVSRALTEVLALERHQKDAAKLDRSGASVRHLFLWVDLQSRIDVVRAFEEGVPTAAPEVDRRITTVWLAVRVTEGVNVLRWSKSGGWRRNIVPVR
ncbi:hypothetical protein OG196_31650 [Kitasatospora purpeofusca]|uniref:hypothetical protein n=1 Tax=Kitasatospora purpeofusca TaxID=67352 RepID=UPI002E12F568|nr:hypothetical protein OG196_31650 [Kitasatospora purpeofusca]